MPDALQDLLVIGDRLLASHTREHVLAKAYHRNRLRKTLEALRQARRLTERLATEYLHATEDITHPGKIADGDLR